MTDEERQKLCAFIVDLRALEHDDKANLLEQMADEIERLADVDYVKFALETAADLLERLAHELVTTNERLRQLEARVGALGRI